MAYDFSKMDCKFTIEQIREATKEMLNDSSKQWNDLQIDILVQGVENSDWLKLPQADEISLDDEIAEWIEMLEQEWKESGEFNYW